METNLDKEFLDIIWLNKVKDFKKSGSLFRNIVIRQNRFSNFSMFFIMNIK